MWRWLTNNHQTLTGIGAMLVGIAALFVAWDQGRVMRAQQHGAVYPVLQVDGFTSARPDIVSMGLRISNNGVGPALIETVSVRRDGVPQEGLDRFLEILPEGYEISWSGLSGRALAPGESLEPIRIDWARTDVARSALQAASVEWEYWELQVCYCSVFDRCWETTLTGGARAQRVQHCEPADQDPFEQLGEAAPAASRPHETPADARPEDDQ